MPTRIRNLRDLLKTAYARGRYEVIYLWPGWTDLATFNVGLAPARAAISGDPRYGGQAHSIEVYAAVADALEAAGGIAPGGRLVEIGCGRGGGLAYLGERFGCRPEGIDTSRTAVAYARRRGLSARRASSTGLPQADASAEAAVAVEILLRFGEADASLAELRRVLKPGGRLVIADFKLGGVPQTYRRIARLAERAGFVLTAFEQLPRIVRRGIAETLMLEGTRRHAEWMDGSRCYFVAVLTAPGAAAGSPPASANALPAAENRA